MNKIKKTPAGLNCPIVLSEEIIAIDDDNMYTAPIVADKDILEFIQSSKNIIDADSCDENETNNAANVPTLFQMRNIMKILHSNLDAHFNGEMYNKMDDIEQFVGNLMLKKDNEKKGGLFFKNSINAVMFLPLEVHLSKFQRELEV
ncbi:hypothetical protein TNCV_1498901 [Trichonephila clavipes]|nr:hypothetical protein TNCV_1498901 [Trichonephila clavipes]